MKSSFESKEMKHVRFKTDFIYDLFFVFYIGFTIFYTSSWQLIHPSEIWNTINISLVAIMLLVSFAKIITSKVSILDYFYLIILLMIGIVNLINSNFALSLIFFLSICIYELKFEEIQRIFFCGILFGVISVALLSFLGVLPMKYLNTNLLVLGFKNPNTLGFYSAMLGILPLLINWKNPKVSDWGIYFTFLLITPIAFDDKTAMVLMIFIALFYFVSKSYKKLFNNKMVRILLSGIPIYLWMLSLWIASNFGSASWSIKVNDFFTNRPNIWHFYLTNYPPKLLPQKIEVITEGFFSFVGNGAFDGMYMTLPILYGWIYAFILIFSLVLIIWKSLKHGNLRLSGFIIAFAIVGFSESIVSSAYQSPIILMAIASIVRKGNETYV